jgi:asparagine synthase (glutamine-hydrolysing)
VIDRMLRPFLPDWVTATLSPDPAIVDFILSLPLERFLAEGFARQPYRTAMTGILPDRIRTRTDKSAPTPDAMLNFARVKSGMLAQVAALRGSAAAGQVDLDAVAAIIAAAPDQGEASMLVRRNAQAPPHWKRVFEALVALSIARQVVR